MYVHGHHESVLRSHRWRTAENSAGYLLPYLKPEMSLLDAGCGPGTITADLASRTAQVTALETSEEVLALARKEVTAQNVTFAVGDVHALSFADDSFDVAHAHQVLQHVADPVRALREMKRVVKPGGIVAVRDSDYAGFTWYPEIPESGGAGCGRSGWSAHRLRRRHLSLATPPKVTCAGWLTPGARGQMSPPAGFLSCTANSSALPETG